MFLLAEVVPDFVKILGYGLSGFAFLLMFFAYMLLRQVISKQTQNTMIIKSIWGFMGLSFILTIVIGIFSYMTGDYKKKELVENEEKITQQQTGIDILTQTQTLDSLVKNVTVGTAGSDTAKVDETITKFENNLTDLQAKLNKVNATEEEKKKVNELKEESTKTLDSLKQTDLSKETRMRLNNKILNQTNEISRITGNAVKRDIKKTGASSRIQPK
jgi:hypothetical protein